MGNRSFARVMRRKTQWGGFASAAGAVSLPTYVALGVGVPQLLSFNIVISGGLGLVDEEFTVTRMIGQFSAQLDVETADAQGTVAVGCVVSRNEAITAGVASLPSPEDDPDAEWLYYGVFGLGNSPVSPTDGAGFSWVRHDFDVRGQRIVRAGSSLVWIAEAQTTAARALVGGRYLTKLT